MRDRLATTGRWVLGRLGLALRRDLEEVAAEAEKLLDPEMKDLRMSDGGINIVAAGHVVNRMCAALVGWCRGNNTENYVEMRLTARDEPYETYLVHVQKMGRFSPNDLREKAEAAERSARAEADQLRSERAALDKELARVRTAECRLGEKCNELSKKVYAANRETETARAEARQAREWARAADARARAAGIVIKDGGPNAV